MAKWDDEIQGAGNYLSTKVGSEVVLTIKEINRVTDKPDFEPKTKDGKGQGFMFEFVGEEGTVGVSTFKLQSVLRDANVDVGDSIRITHPAAGEYLVEKL